MKLILAILLVACSAHAQYRFNRYTASASTNAFVGAYSNQPSVNSSMEVAAGNYVQLFFYFSLCSTNTGPILTTATNPVTTYWDASFDGERYTNEFTWSVNAKTNGEAWGLTNIPITYPHLRFKYMSNGNPAAVTNWGIKVGQKIGL